MTLTAPAVLIGVAAGMTALIVLELRSGPSTELSPNAAPRHATPITSAASGTVEPDHSDAWIKTVLARPLFSSTRRPDAEPTVAGAGPGPGLPRLAGIVVSSGGKNAIFAAAGDGKPVIARVGDQIGSFTVIEIAAGEVAVLGPGGKQLLHPTFDPNPKATSAAASSGPPAPPPPSQSPPQARNMIDGPQTGSPTATSLPPAPSIQQMLSRRRQDAQQK